MGIVRPFTLARDGDVVEQRYWREFLAKRFPSYGSFWAAHVVPVTRREIVSNDIRFRSDAELGAIGGTHEDLAVAQLHYTVMVHLGRVFDLRRSLLDRWAFAEVLVRLSGASDCADELLERRTNPGVYASWSEREGRDARNKWRSRHGRPLQAIHDYRNRLVHGRVVPEVIASVKETEEQVFIYPSIDRVDDYLDWRYALDDVEAALARGDFQSAQAIAEEAWDQVVDYCEQQWSSHLVPPQFVPIAEMRDDLPPPSGGSASVPHP